MGVRGAWAGMRIRPGMRMLAEPGGGAGVSHACRVGAAQEACGAARAVRSPAVLCAAHSVLDGWGPTLLGTMGSACREARAAPVGWDGSLVLHAALQRRAHGRHAHTRHTACSTHQQAAGRRCAHSDARAPTHAHPNMPSNTGQSSLMLNLPRQLACAAWFSGVTRLRNST